jgi:hypothetical protein
VRTPVAVLVRFWRPIAISSAVGAVLALAFLFRASLWREAGMFYLGDDNFRAQACFEKALLLHPDDKGALAGLGVAYGELGCWQDGPAPI